MEEADRKLDQHAIWDYKYIGTIDASHLQYMFIDLEATATPVMDPIIKGILEEIKGTTRIRIFYSNRSKEFIIEPERQFNE